MGFCKKGHSTNPFNSSFDLLQVFGFRPTFFASILDYTYSWLADWKAGRTWKGYVDDHDDDGGGSDGGGRAKDLLMKVTIHHRIVNFSAQLQLF